ncbi:MAG: right-handed parallel beta-helix repeat-containing protein [Planctomycetota bacterium]|nr:right-handed parallel beta-helix repeat-containing protein [Planctomycetota bacterium]
MLALHRIALAAAVLTSSVAAQMAGPYSINPLWPASSINFTSLAAAVQALTTNGVAGPVVLEVYDDAGPYNEASPFLPNTLWAPSTAVLVLTNWAGASATNRVTFRPAAGESPVLDATGRAIGVFWGGADYVTLEGFEIRNAPFDAISMYADSTHGVANDAIISRCRLHDCGGSGVSIYGNSSYPVNTLVANNLFWHLQTTHAGAFNTTGRLGYVSTRRTTNTRVVHNTFLVDTAAGTSCAIGGYPSSATEAPFAEVSNNIVLKTGAPSRPIFLFQPPTGSTAPVPVVCDSNCFFDLSGGPFALHGSGGATIAATLIDWQTNTGRDLASLGADPLLLDIASQNFHLAALSPCIGASTVAAGIVEDVDGQPRTVSLDIGADEYSAATITSVGVGCQGTGSIAPVLSSREWPFLGNQQFALTCSQMPPNQAMLVFASFGTTTSPFVVGFGCNVYLQLAFLTGLPVVPVAGSAGTASVVVPWPANPAYVGVNYAFQAMVIDSGAPMGITLTNALDIVLGF